MKYGFLIHVRTKDIFAVRFSDDGNITGAYGPIRKSEVKMELAPLFAYSLSIAELIEGSRSEFNPYRSGMAAGEA